MCGPRKPVPRAGLWPAGRMLHASDLDKAYINVKLQN